MTWVSAERRFEEHSSESDAGSPDVALQTVEQETLSVRLLLSDANSSSAPLEGLYVGIFIRY